MDGFNAISWSRLHDRTEFASRYLDAQWAKRPPIRACRAVCVFPPCVSNGRGAERQGTNNSASSFASGAVRAHLSSVEERSGKSPEATATLHARPVARAGRIRRARRSSVEPLPASLLRSFCAGEFDPVRRSRGASEHQADRLVPGLNRLPFGIPTADFERPTRIRSP